MHRLVAWFPLLLPAALLCAACPAAPTPGPASPVTSAEPEPTASPALPPASAPASAGATAEPPVLGPAIVTLRVVLGPAGSMVLDGQPVADLDALEARLRELASARTVELVIAASPEVPYAQVREILDRAKAAGIAAVSIERAQPIPSHSSPPPPSSTVSSSPAAGPPQSPATLPRVNSGNASRVTPKVGLPSADAPIPITPSPVPESVWSTLR